MRRPEPVHLYVAAVTLVGLGLVGVVLGRGGPDVEEAFAQFWLFTALVALGELLPVRMSRLDGESVITTSTIFTFALLLRFGVAAAVTAQTIASVGADLGNHRAFWKTGFNAAQYAISLALSGVVLAFLSGAPHLGGVAHFGSADVPAMVAAAIVYLVLNHAITGAGIALSLHMPVLGSLLRGIGPQLSIDGSLVALSPIAVVAAERSLLLLPVLAVPMGIIYRGAADYAEREYKEYLALHDSLTGLPNRPLFYDRVGQALVEARRNARLVAVMIIDLDRFKEINDSLGHHVGDLLLRRIGPRLRARLRDGDTVARLGGDEFAVLLPDVASTEAVEEIAQEIGKGLEEPFVLEEVLEGLTLDIEASVGIALAPDHGDDVDTLIQRADVAMYLAKEAHSGYERYTVARDRHSPAQVALLGELRRAIEREELVFYYQPKAELRTGRVTGVEALMRWRHPKRGLLTPDEFIGAAERTGLIEPLTLYAIELALSQWHEWQRRGIRTNVAVNLARRNLLNLRFPEEVARRIEKWRVPPGCLELEITESSIMADPARAAEVLNRLRSLGVGLALDDFGAGYSSLAYLKDLPVDEIKIDKSFVMSMATDESDRAIVRSTIDLGRNLGLRVVAEGVECLETWRRLASLGCELAQGYYLSAPMPPEELPRWLASFRSEHAPGLSPAVAAPLR